MNTVITTRHWYIEILPNKHRGWFEHKTKEIDGGLWFEYNNGKWYLTDYDGVYVISEEILNALLSINCVIEDVFFPDFEV